MNITEKELRAMVHTFYEAGTLRTTSRAHQRRLLTHDPSDSIAAHSFRAALIAWFLAKLEGVDPYKVALMTLLHDFPEARTGDADWVVRNYVHEDEERAAREQLWVVPFGKELLELLLKFQQEESLEVQVTKDADYLAQLILLKEYARRGNREAAAWLERDDLPQPHTDSARALAREIVHQTPSDWWLKEKIYSAEKK